MMCFPADMPLDPDPDPDGGRWTKPRPPRDWYSCDICGSKDGVRIIEQRVKWGKAARQASHT